MFGCVRGLDFKSQQEAICSLHLADLVNHFNMDADALRGMLGKWISKGNVRKMPMESSCGTSCCKCDPALTELYEWIER